MLAQEITARWPGLKLKEEIGHGAYGKVYKVLNTECSPPVEEALKVISIPLTEDTTFMGNPYYLTAARTLAREATILSDLSGNPYIVRYYDHAIIPRDSGVGYDILIRMELLTPFRRHVAEHGLLRQDVVKLGIDICRALELCRKRGVIHRDIKPENIFISDVGNYKLGDFGVAVNADKTLGGLSKKGTYSYMAPEVYKGADYGPSIDIYSLGMILYRLLNNDRDAFVPSAKDSVVTFDDTQQALSRRMRGEALPYPENERGLLGDIVKKATSPLPEDRYHTPEEMRAELEMLVDKSDTALLRLPGGGPEVISLTMTPYRTELRVGETAAVKATVTVTGGSYGGAVKWNSSDPSVMSVTTDGPQTATVTCIGSGSCYITAEAEGRSQECPFTGLPEEKPEPLPPKDASSSFVYESTSHLSRRFLGWFWYGWKGRQEDETGAVAPPTENDVETQRFQGKKKVLLIACVAVLLLSIVLIVSSGAVSSATVAADVVDSTDTIDIAADAAGENEFSDIDEENTTEQSSEPEVYSLTLNQRTIQLAEGESTTLTASVGMSEGDFSGTVKWTSSDESIVTVESSGNLTAVVTCVDTGNCYVTAEAGSCTQICLFVCTEVNADKALDNNQGEPDTENIIGYLNRVFYDDETLVYPAQIVTIIFLNAMESAPENAQDVSRAGDGSVLAWIKESDAEPSIPLESDDYFGEGSYRYYDLYIAADGGVTISGDCSYLFSDMAGEEFRDFCFINLSNIDFNDSFYVGAITDMSGMFYACESLTSLDLSGWDTSGVTDMSSMFCGCMALTELDVSTWDTSNVTKMSYMFDYCESLKSLDLSGWDTSNVANMKQMFYNCPSLTDFDPDWLDTSNADTTDMYTGTKWQSTSSHTADLAEDDEEDSSNTSTEAEEVTSDDNDTGGTSTKTLYRWRSCEWEWDWTYSSDVDYWAEEYPDFVEGPTEDGATLVLYNFSSWSSWSESNVINGTMYYQDNGQLTEDEMGLHIIGGRETVDGIETHLWTLAYQIQTKPG